MRETIEVGIMFEAIILDSWNENKEAIIASSIKRFEDSGSNNEVVGVHLEMTYFIQRN